MSMENMSVDDALTIVLELAIDNFAPLGECPELDDENSRQSKAWQVVVAYQLLNIRGKPFPLSNGKPKRSVNQCR